MGGDNPPTFRQARPQLALPSLDQSSVRLTLELQRNAAELASEGDYVQPADGASQIRRVTALAEGCDFIDAVEIFRDAETCGMGRGPEQAHERFDVVADEGGFVPRIEFLQLRDGLRVVDLHVWCAPVQKSFRCGSTCLGSDALTVNMGSFTTWLKRRFMATLHNR